VFFFCYFLLLLYQSSFGFFSSYFNILFVDERVFISIFGNIKFKVSFCLIQLCFRLLLIRLQVRFFFRFFAHYYLLLQVHSFMSLNLFHLFMRIQLSSLTSPTLSNPTLFLLCRVFFRFLFGEHFIQGYLFYNATLLNLTSISNKNSFHMSDIRWTALDEEDLKVRFFVLELQYHLKCTWILILKYIIFDFLSFLWFVRFEAVHAYCEAVREV